MTALPFAFYLVGSTRTPFWRILAIVYMAAATLGVAATFSRTSFLMLPVVTVLCLFRVVRSRRAVAWMVVPGIAVLLSMSLIPSDRLNARIDSIGGYIDDTFRSTETGDVTSSRGYHLRIALAMFTDHPYFGSGFDSFGRGFLDYQLEVPGAKKLWRSQRASHSSHAGLLADLGLAGIVLWTALFIGALAYTSAAFRSFSVAASSPRRDLVYAIGVTILVQLLYGFAADVHKDKLLWLLFGLVIAVYRVSRQESAGAGLRYPVPQPGQAP
ncbi:MAG: O-antigen ligase family protein [Longimicrobiales bacterium]